MLRMCGRYCRGRTEKALPLAGKSGGTFRQKRQGFWGEGLQEAAGGAGAAGQ